MRQEKMRGARGGIMIYHNSFLFLFDCIVGEESGESPLDWDVKYNKQVEYTVAMRVLAIDPGFGRAGVAVIDRIQNADILQYSACIVTSAQTPFPERLNAVMVEITALIGKHSPTLFALEKLFLTNNQKTAMRVAEVRGALIALAASREIPILEYTPLQVKVAITGYGKSRKSDIMRMLPHLIILPDARTRLDDEYDAIAIGLTALASYRP